MDTSELLHFFHQAQHDIGCEELSLRCDCENLETVYVVDRAGKLTVTDRGETFQYLDRLDDDDYGPIDVDRARAICRRDGVDLLDDGDDEL